eukprot:4857043-Prymnesium_polylepis.1
MARAAAKENGVRLAVVSEVSMARKVWDHPPDVLLSEAVGEDLLSEGMLPQLRNALEVLTRGRGHSAGAPKGPLVLPRRANVQAVAVQLSFEGVDGFGLDGLDVDLRHFDALRPNGAVAAQPPGFWPVRLLPARQPHRRLSGTFAACAVEFGVAEAGGESREIEVEATADGLLNAVVYWFELH